MKVLFPTLNVSIGPYLVGRIGFEILSLAEAGLTGI